MGLLDAFTGDKKKKKEKGSPDEKGKKTIKKILISAGITIGIVLLIIYALVMLINQIFPFLSF